MWQGTNRVKTERYGSLGDNFSNSQPHLGKSSGGMQLFMEISRVWCDTSEKGWVAWGEDGKAVMRWDHMLWFDKSNGSKNTTCHFQTNQLIAYVRFNHPVFSCPSNNGMSDTEERCWTITCRNSQPRETSRPPVFFVWKANKPLLF